MLFDTSGHMRGNTLNEFKALTTDPVIFEIGHSFSDL